MNFIVNLFIDALFDLAKIAISVSFLWLISFVIYYFRRNESFFKRFLTPTKRIFRYSQTDFQRIEIILEEHQFENIFTDEEQKNLLVHNKSKSLFNGAVVRLNSLKENIFYLEKVTFFDFMTTNMLYKPANSKLLSPQDTIWHMLFDNEFKENLKLENKLKAKISWYGKIKSFNDVLEIRELSNIIAISILITDKSGAALIIRRGKSNAISSGTFVVSSTGSMTVEDLSKPNPFIFAGQREVKEELNLDVNLTITGVIIVKQKLQPVVLLEGTIPFYFHEVAESIKEAPDFKKENTKIYSVPQKYWLGITKKYNFSDTSSYQLSRSCNQIQWLFHPKKKIDFFEI